MVGVSIKHDADRFQLFFLGMTGWGIDKRHLFLMFFAHFVFGPFLIFVVILVFGDFQYTTMRKEMPLQNALFLLIPVSYVAGWTLDEMGQSFPMRKQALKNITKSFENRYIISFYTSFRYGGSIEENDFEMLRTILVSSNTIKNRKILFIINSPGGNPLAAEKIIKLLSEYSDNDFWVLIPGTAKSAATLICFGSSKIILSPISELGPIDLQIDRGNGILMPTYTIVEAYDKLMEKGINLEEGQNIAPILQQLQSFDPSEIEQFRRINELSSDIAVKVLKHCMMRKVNQREVKKVINIFTDPEKSKTHGRPIFGSDIERVDKNRYFNIECVKTTDKIWQNITEYHMRMVAHMRGNQIVKVIESEEDSIEAVKS
jgi:ClpP class serine protease